MASAMLLLDTYPSHVYSYLGKNHGIVSLQRMKTMLPIWLAVLLVIAPTFPFLHQAIEKDSDAPEIPFHTPFYTDGFVVPGIIDATLTIGPEQEAILLKEHVTVTPSGRLIILPGTTIFASEYSGIRVQGRLDAQGNENNPIVFTSNEKNEQNRNWNGIFYEDQSAGSIRYTEFHYASPAIACQHENIQLQQNTYRFGNLDTYGPCAVQISAKSVQ